MKWFSESYEYKSDRNGTIIVRRNFGVWRVSVKNCGQTTDHNRAVWTDAIKRVALIRPGLSVSSVLMLGLGAAGEISTLHKQFPNCTVTAIEYDHEMVGLAKKLKLYEPFPFPTVLLGDAAQVVPTIVGTFDLIMLDLFSGEEPSPLATNEVFLQQLRERLSSNGLLLINIYKRDNYLEATKQIFSNSKIWKYRFNNLGAFW